MSLYVIEGTWEEIERHKAELVDRQLRLTVMPEKPVARKPSAPAKLAAKPKELVGFGAFRDALSSTEQYMREKREETLREDRSL